MVSLPDVHLSYGVCMFDKESMIQNKHGDDHHFNSKTARTFGVFDGVSGSNKKYGEGAAERAANQMCHASWQEARRQASRGMEPSPEEIIVKAHSTLVERGSTTAIVGSFHKADEDPNRALLVVANVGDCGLIVVRPRLADQSDDASTATATYSSSASSSDSRDDYSSYSFSDYVTERPRGPSTPALVFKTEVRRYKGQMSKPHTISVKTSHRSLLKKLDHTETMVEVGDIIVVGSDGLWDNIPHETVARYCLHHQEKRPAAIALLLGKMAVQGHKRDDITVLVGRVVPSDRAEESKES